MTIEEKDFIIEYEDHCNKFNLSLLYVKNANKPEKRSEEFKIHGYGMSLEHCMEVIINHRIAKKKDVYTLKEYLEEYRIQSQAILDLKSKI